jgi:hypothetical protein
MHKVLGVVALMRYNSGPSPRSWFKIMKNLTKSYKFSNKNGILIIKQNKRHEHSCTTPVPPVKFYQGVGHGVGEGRSLVSGGPSFKKKVAKLHRREWAINIREKGCGSHTLFVVRGQKYLKKHKGPPLR